MMSDTTTKGEVPNAGVREASTPNSRSRKRSMLSTPTVTTSAKNRSRRISTKKSSTSDNDAAAVASLSKHTSPSKTSYVATTATPPKYVLVLDNGSDTVKYGWATDPQKSNDASSHTNDDHVNPKQDAQCQHMPNITARLVQQWTILIGNDITTHVKNPNVSCTALTRSCNERGMITNMGNQIQVWKHILDSLNVAITPFTATETSIAFGWNKVTPKPNQHRDSRAVTNNAVSHNTKSISSNQCGVMIGLPPYTPRSIIEHIMSIWYDEFSFSNVGFCVSAVAAAIDRPINSFLSKQQQSSMEKLDTLNESSSSVPIACVVDFGYSAIHIIPVYDKKVIVNNVSGCQNGTIRRIPFGGKHMINLLKYYFSYRQWNLMDSEWIVRDVFEKTAFVSTSFTADIYLARNVPHFGKRPYDCEYILPNYDTTLIGQVRIPESVQLEIDRMKQQQSEGFHATTIDAENDEEEDEDDEDYNENDMNVDDGDDDSDGIDDDEDDENESPEQIRQRLMKQREDERRLREIEAEQHQVLNISTERFAIPESLFRPSDVGLPREWANVPQAITQAIEACPLIYRPALYRSIQLTGGLSRIPNLKDRLLVELRALVPCQYLLDVTIADAPTNHAWNGITNITRQQPHDEWSVSKEEWEGLSKRGAWRRLQMKEGGHLI